MPQPRPASDARSRRQQAEKAGRRAERICGLWLRLKGYRILATRYKSPAGEIDIVARHGGLIVAIEVKNRPDRHSALHAIRPQQQQRIARALSHYAARIGHRGDLRLDLMIVGKFGRIAHLKNAWRIDDRLGR